MNERRAKAQSLNAKESLILEILRKDHRPRSAYDLIAELRGSGVVAPATVYRALQRLMDHGHVHRLESLNAYLACRHSACHEHASSMFAICDDCGSVVELTDNAMTAPALKWAKRNSFALHAMTYELRGTCAHCAAQSH